MDLEQPQKNWRTINYKVDRGLGSRAHIGMVVISNDQTLSYEARAILTIPGVALYESRLPTTRRRNEPVTAQNLSDQAVQIDAAVRQINTLVPSDVIALGCTSAAMIIGSRELERRVRLVHPGAHVTDPFAAIMAALRAAGSRQVAYLSPYPPDLAGQMVKSIDRAGPSVTIVGSFENPNGFIGDEAPFITPESISEAVKEIVEQADVDTVIVACTQMRAAGVIDTLERETGKLIISSNQALCWHALRLVGCSDQVKGFGKLFELSIPED